MDYSCVKQQLGCDGLRSVESQHLYHVGSYSRVFFISVGIKTSDFSSFLGAMQLFNSIQATLLAIQNGLYCLWCSL